MSTVPRPPSSSSPSPRERSWRSSNWKWSTLLLALLLIVIVGLVVAWPMLRPRMHPQYWEALNEIGKNPVAKEKLGEPIKPVRWLPAGDLTATSAKLNFEVQGPKGKAQVATFSRLLDDKWGFAALELTFADGQRIDLAKGMEGDMPAFDPNAKQPDVKQPDLPVDIQLPDLPKGPGK